AGPGRAAAWARNVLWTPAGEAAKKNALLILGRQKEKIHERVALSNQDLRGQDFSGQDLSSADLTGADLTEARLSGAEFRETTLSRAKLRRSKLLGTEFDAASLSAADTFGAAFNLSELLPQVIGATGACRAIAWSSDGEFLAIAEGDVIR